MGIPGLFGEASKPRDGQSNLAHSHRELELM